MTELTGAVKVAHPEGEVHLLHRDADYDDRVRYRHLVAEHRRRHEVIHSNAKTNIMFCMIVHREVSFIHYALSHYQTQ